MVCESVCPTDTKFNRLIWPSSHILNIYYNFIVMVIFLWNLLKYWRDIPVNIYLFKVNNRNTRKRCKISSKLTIKIPERGHWRHTVVFIVNFEHISYLFLQFLLLILRFYLFPGIFILSCWHFQIACCRIGHYSNQILQQKNRRCEVSLLLTLTWWIIISTNINHSKFCSLVLILAISNWMIKTYS